MLVSANERISEKSIIFHLSVNKKFTMTIVTVGAIKNIIDIKTNRPFFGIKLGIEYKEVIAREPL